MRFIGQENNGEYLFGLTRKDLELIVQGMILLGHSEELFKRLQEALRIIKGKEKS